MTCERHGLSIGIERVNEQFYLAIKVIGELTHEDYEVMVPMIENAMHGLKEPKVKALVDLSELNGWTMHAVWDDFKFSLKHGNEFSKIAVVSHKNWMHLVSQIGSWFVSGEVESFEEINPALQWLSK